MWTETLFTRKLYRAPLSSAVKIVSVKLFLTGAFGLVKFEGWEFEQRPGVDSEADHFMKMWLNMLLRCCTVIQNLKNCARTFVEAIFVCKILSIWMNSREEDYAEGLAWDISIDSMIFLYCCKNSASKLIVTNMILKLTTTSVLDGIKNCTFLTATQWKDEILKRVSL